MTRKFILIILALPLIAAFVYFYGGSQAPAGQAPLQSLSAQNLSSIKDSFNAARGQVRVLLFLSPT